ncbi:MAG: flagellar biosynthesis GTPase FlhF [Gammaproteobacteria bacterium]|jgi:flagellar biosynthesis GTPase FlhF
MTDLHPFPELTETVEAPAASSDHEGPARRFRGSTYDEALTAAADELGQKLRVIEANRIRRGGLGGFFATDLGVEISVVAEPDDLDDDSGRRESAKADSEYSPTRSPARALGSFAEHLAVENGGAASVLPGSSPDGNWRDSPIDGPLSASVADVLERRTEQINAVERLHQLEGERHTQSIEAPAADRESRAQNWPTVEPAADTERKTIEQDSAAERAAAIEHAADVQRRRIAAEANAIQGLKTIVWPAPLERTVSNGELARKDAARTRMREAEREVGQDLGNEAPTPSQTVPVVTATSDLHDLDELLRQVGVAVPIAGADVVVVALAPADSMASRVADILMATERCFEHVTRVSVAVTMPDGMAFKLTADVDGRNA